MIYDTQKMVSVGVNMLDKQDVLIDEVKGVKKEIRGLREDLKPTWRGFRLETEIAGIKEKIGIL